MWKQTDSRAQEGEKARRAGSLDISDIPLRFSKPVIGVFREVYGPEWERAILAVTRPPSKYYLRVNTLKASPEDVVRMLREEGLDFHQSDVMDEAIYMEVEATEEYPEYSHIVVVDRWAAESVMIGANLYAPGVVRFPRVGRGETVGIVDELGLLVGVGKTVMDWREARAASRGMVVRVTHPAFRVPSTRDLDVYGNGLVYPQSLPSMVVSRVLDPREGDVVVDMCAAPGGKLSHIAALSRNRAKIYGFDKSRRKVEQLRENLRRLGVRAEVLKMDTRYLDLEMPSLRADKVLIDPPCSALGVRPKLGSRIDERTLKNYPTYQAQFLRVAERITRPGGEVVFSVCTITKGEIEGMAKVGESLGLELREQEFFVGSAGLDGYGKSVQRFHPHIHDTPGFGIVKFIKKGL